MKWRAAIAVSLLAGACSSIQPVAVQLGDRCFRCRRPITEGRLAAEMVDPQGRAYPFRSSGCLAKYLRSHPGETGTLFVSDYRSGRLIDSTSAWFVPTDIGDGRVPEPDYLAFKSRADADAANKEHASVIRWTGVLEAVPAN